ncbi:putative peptidylglycine alpha-hydroxylating monooxygenase 1 [Parelaphostrongylus tenuis]|uniref:peptidylglycine monooxygenase n=1 Tax=Parelaphostrongylus tenuis TaxID=148309 RepID=A0AAD5N5K6_PARTN|nr:putative peptidylglycine alpha-hydroxylating monooxygenase 1 [Parelaphostrongylus tenuis]
MKAKAGGMLGLIVALFALAYADETKLLMPGVIPQAESYVCTAVPLDPDGEHYLTGYRANVDSHNAHHILLFGCDEPGSDDEVWDCGEMTAVSDGLRRAPTCKSNPAILYAWAKNARELHLPKGVGFPVGGNSGINYLVMQVHYMEDRDEPDQSGVTVQHTEEVQPKTAATMLLVTGGLLPPKSTESFETACVIDEDVVLHPFAYRTHAHRHGVEIAGWVINENEKGDDEWFLIGKRDPQLPQMFAPVQNKSLVIRQGDMVAARCIMKNDENRVVTMGSTAEDEMCNLYVMYWTDGDRVLSDNTCSSPGAPFYHWSSDAGLNHIPK